MRLVVFCPLLVAQDAERHHRSRHGTGELDGLLDHTTVRGKIRCVEVDNVHGRGAARSEFALQRLEPMRAARGQHHRVPRCEQPGDLPANVAAPAENKHRAH